MKLLFISHDVSRTGAPLVLLHFLKWLQEYKPKVTVDVMALSGGPLETDFKKNCNTYYNYTELIKPKPLTLWQRVLLKLRLYEKPDLKEVLLKQLAKNNYNIVYANTIVTIP
ncbi:MAG TPA: hypothetical protein VF985_02040, partial [Mariniflexile sp.]